MRDLLQLQEFMHPWQRTSRSPLIPYTPFDAEPEVIGAIRRQDTSVRAPFSDQTMIVVSTMAPTDYEVPKGFSMAHGTTSRVTDVPVIRIIGIGSSGNLDCHAPGMTFREVLFECLHGQGITEESIDFLVGPQPKSVPLPHVPLRDVPKTRARGPLELAKYGDWFVVTAGHQRGLVAMYAIWQRFGDAGCLRSVRVSGD